MDSPHCPICYQPGCRGRCIENIAPRVQYRPSPDRPTLTMRERLRMSLMDKHARDAILTAALAIVGIVLLVVGSVGWLRIIRGPEAPAPIVSKVGAWTNEQADEHGQTIMALRPWPGATAPPRGCRRGLAAPLPADSLSPDAPQRHRRGARF